MQSVTAHWHGLLALGSWLWVGTTAAFDERGDGSKEHTPTRVRNFKDAHLALLLMDLGARDRSDQPAPKEV